MTIDHVKDRGCVSTLCVNPAHLEAVTMRENNLRGRTNACAVNARKTLCKRGHPLSGDNLYLIPSGAGRACRECRHMEDVAYKARKKQRLLGAARV